MAVAVGRPDVDEAGVCNLSLSIAGIEIDDVRVWACGRVSRNRACGLESLGTLGRGCEMADPEDAVRE
jgi:hypothetical protein